MPVTLYCRLEQIPTDRQYRSSIPYISLPAHRYPASELLASGKLNGHLVEIDRHAYEMFSRLVDEMAKNEGVTEKLKAENQMEWVGRMNNIRERAREIVNDEIIYL